MRGGDVGEIGRASFSGCSIAFVLEAISCLCSHVRYCSQQILSLRAGVNEFCCAALIQVPGVIFNLPNSG